VHHSHFSREVRRTRAVSAAINSLKTLANQEPLDPTAPAATVLIPGHRGGAELRVPLSSIFNNGRSSFKRPSQVEVDKFQIVFGKQPLVAG
jgi:hypothetical protein